MASTVGFSVVVYTARMPPSWVMGTSTVSARSAVMRPPVVTGIKASVLLLAVMVSESPSLTSSSSTMSGYCTLKWVMARCAVWL